MHKDFYQIFCIKKNLFGFFLGILSFVVIFFTMPSKYIVVLFVALAIPMMSVSPLQYSLERDELSKFDQILLTFPISKKKIIMTKFLEAYLFSLGCLLLLSLPIVLASIYGYQTINLQEGLFILLIGILFSLITIPINTTGFMMLGNKKGTIIYMVLLISYVVGFIILNYVMGIEQLLLVPLNNWLLFGGILAIVLNVLSYFACVKIFEIKHS